MSGKKVNVSIGITIILLAIYMIILPINIEDNTDFNRYENMFFNVLNISKIVLVIFLSLVSIVFAIANRNENGLRNSYLLFPLTILNFVLPHTFFSILTLISGILVIYFTLKKNYVAIDSYFIFSIFIIISIVIVLFIFSTFFIPQITNLIKEEVEKEIGIVKYDEEFFKYITPITDEPAYISLSILEDGKKQYGYIDNKGNTKINFEYDFVTPFYRIKVYDKEFLVAAVSKEEITEVILKNKRVVMSYVSEFEHYDYIQKTKEFENILKNIFKQKEIITEISKDTSNITRKKVSPKEKEQEYTYKFSLNQDKDILIYESAVGNPTKYIMKNTKAPYAEMKLETTNLMYNEDYLYTFRNNTIPFYDRDRNEQGWFMPDR